MVAIPWLGFGKHGSRSSKFIHWLLGENPCELEVTMNNMSLGHTLWNVSAPLHLLVCQTMSVRYTTEGHTWWYWEALTEDACDLNVSEASYFRVFYRKTEIPYTAEVCSERPRWGSRTVLSVSLDRRPPWSNPFLFALSRVTPPPRTPECAKRVLRGCMGI